MKKLLLLIINLGLILAIEKPNYTIISIDGKIEIREYEPMIIASTRVSLSYQRALSEGFRRIANYIFGANDKGISIPMTAPVISKKIEQQLESYEVIFVMPKLYDLTSLPKPIETEINIEKKNLSKVVAIKFGGWATEKRVIYYIEKLKNYNSL